MTKLLGKCDFATIYGDLKDETELVTGKMAITENKMNFATAFL